MSARVIEGSGFPHSRYRESVAWLYTLRVYSVGWSQDPPGELRPELQALGNEHHAGRTVAGAAVPARDPRAEADLRYQSLLERFDRSAADGDANLP